MVKKGTYCSHHTTYWYHPDHLGSSSWITGSTGKPVEHLHYLPWGEDFVHQRNTDFQARYTFSAKEKDEITGYSYFGARHYNSDLSIWLSVDPMSDKYPSTSPYTYCANNPVRLVDPNGREYIPVGDEEAKAAAVSQIQSQTNLFVYIDNYGYLRAEGKAKNKIDRFLQKSCNDESVQVFLNCKNENSFRWSDGSIRGTAEGGGYNGNYLWESAAIASQFVCPSMLAAYDASCRDERPGLTMIHEMAEAYFGGKIALRTGKGSPMAEVQGTTYDRAHKMATRIAWANRSPIYKKDDFRINPITNKVEKGPFETFTGYYERVP